MNTKGPRSPRASCDFSSVIQLLDLADQRRSPRSHCRILGSFRSMSCPRVSAQEGLIVDISESGFRMIAAFPVEPGTLLAVRIDECEELDSPLVFASVVRCLLNQKTWELGCSFVDAFEQFDA